MLAQTMNDDLGIIRCEEKLNNGIEDISYYLSVANKIRFDRSELSYFAYSLTGILTLAKATLLCAKFREESRGAHFRSDHQKSDEKYKASTIISYNI